MTGERRTIPKRLTYPLLAMLLSLGAPLGLLILEALRTGGLSPARIAGVLAGATWTYAYVTFATLLAFSLFGYALGRQADRLIELARTDGLTGLGNTRAFRERLLEEAARAERYGQPLSLVLLDLDGLKAINDRSGHRAGDAALAQLAAEIRAEARATDSCARWGGDEFAVLAPSTPEDAAAALAERIRSRVAAQELVDGLTVSVGVATLSPAMAAPDAPDDLVRTADRALYRAKALGRNRVCQASRLVG